MTRIATDQRCSPPLSPQQIAALECLLTGSTVTDAAHAASVSRETLHRWLRSDDEFIAARNAAVSDLRSVTTARMEKAAAAAADVVLKAVESGDLSAAMKVLQGFGWLSGDARPAVGPSSAAEIRAEKDAVAQATQRRQRIEAAFATGHDDIDGLGF